MKKIWVIVLAMLLVCSITMALAEDVIELDRITKTGNTSVSLTVNNNRDTYIVVIPSKVEIDPVTQYGEGTITLKSGWQLISINGLDVKLTEAENGVGTSVDSSNVSITNSNYQNFKMKSESGNTVTYAIQPSGLKPLSAAGSNTRPELFTYYSASLISINKGGDNSTDKSCTLTFYVKTMPPAGIYTDTLTFSIVTR